MRRIVFLLLAVISIAAGNAFALPKTQAKQVTVDPSGILSSTNTTVQAVLEDLDEAIPGQATTTTAGTVRFATPAEVNAGTSTAVVISPSNLCLALALVPYMHVRDEKPSGTDAGSFTAGSYVTRTLNTNLYNSILGASLASSQITLPSGTYYISAKAPSFDTGNHRIRIYNTSASAVLLLGTNTHPGTGGQQTSSFATGIFTLSSTSTIELQHRASTTKSATGLGQSCFFGDNEIYSDVEVWKLK